MNAIEPTQSPELVTSELRMDDLSEEATERIRRFLADGTVKGGASPADVANLYTSIEIVADARATAYLDRRYVGGEMPDDWREFQDALDIARLTAPIGLTGPRLLAKVEQEGAAARPPRSIFDDPVDLDEPENDLSTRLLDRDPALVDLSEEGRGMIEHHVVSEVMGYGIPPARTMGLREILTAAGDERSLQYFDLPFDRGERPGDWDELRDWALLLRGRMEFRGWDPSEVFSRTEATQPGLDARGLLKAVEERVDSVA